MSHHPNQANPNISLEQEKAEVQADLNRRRDNGQDASDQEAHLAGLE